MASSSYMGRQNLEPYYRENGAEYVVDAGKIINSNYNFYVDKCVGYVMPKERSVDIDSEIDFVLAEICMKNNGKRA